MSEALKKVLAGCLLAGGVAIWVPQTLGSRGAPEQEMAPRTDRPAEAPAAPAGDVGEPEAGLPAAPAPERTAVVSAPWPQGEPLAAGLGAAEGLQSELNAALEQLERAIPEERGVRLASLARGWSRQRTSADALTNADGDLPPPSLQRVERAEDYADWLAANPVTSIIFAGEASTACVGACIVRAGDELPGAGLHVDRIDRRSVVLVSREGAVRLTLTLPPLQVRPRMEDGEELEDQGPEQPAEGAGPAPLGSMVLEAAPAVQSAAGNPTTKTEDR